MYYYLVATLPFLDFAATQEVDIDGFTAFALSMLPEKEGALLLEAAEGGDSSHPFIREAAVFEAEFAAELARNRALKLGRDPGQYPEASRAWVSERARQLAGIEDPYEAEMGTMRLRWEFLEELESGHYFDLERLIVHLLKLQLLDRKLKLTEERGTARYAETYAHITQALKDADVGV